MMFGPYSKNTVLCDCGIIASLDSEVVSRKRNLGRHIECMACRNRMILEEHECLELHFAGLDDQNEY